MNEAPRDLTPYESALDQHARAIEQLQNAVSAIGKAYSPARLAEPVLPKTPECAVNETACASIVQQINMSTSEILSAVLELQRYIRECAF